MNDLFAESGRQATHGHFMTTPAGSGQSRIGLATKRTPAAERAVSSLSMVFPVVV
jgi:hypothetical protein